MDSNKRIKTLGHTLSTWAVLVLFGSSLAACGVASDDGLSGLGGAGHGAGVGEAAEAPEAVVDSEQALLTVRSLQERFLGTAMRIRP